MSQWNEHFGAAMTLDLFSQPRARTSDPQTSKDAAQSMREAAHAQRAVILEALATRDATADELDARCGFRSSVAGRRLHELVRAGLVTVTDQVRVTRSGRMANVYRRVA